MATSDPEISNCVVAAGIDSNELDAVWGYAPLVDNRLSAKEDA
ncbi:MAG: hypothetical protein ACKVQU_36135 [Burkholderiales bacterium]